jgi:hypothetical protein
MAPGREPVSEREYYKHKDTGDRAYLIERDGETLIKLDTGPNGPERPFIKSQWIRDVDHRPYTRHAIARVAYAADLELVRVLGIHEPRRKDDFMSMSQKEAEFWMFKGPTHPLRRSVWFGIMSELLPYSQDSEQDL